LVLIWFLFRLQLLDWGDSDLMIQEILEFTQQQLQQNALTTVSPYAPHSSFFGHA
jgi:hypothetical protein